MITRGILTAFLIASSVCLQPVLAAETLSRTVLVLYDRNMTENPNYMRTHRIIEMPLNHLGLKAEHFDISKGFPNLEGRSDVLGILTWYQSEDSIKDSAAYAKWMRDAIERYKKKFVIIGTTGLGKEKGDVLSLLGLSYTPCSDKRLIECGWSDKTDLAKYSIVNEEMVGFEWPLKENLYSYHHYKKVGSQTKVHLALTPFPESKSDAVLVSTHSNGGVVDGNYVLYSDYDKETGNDDRAWIINPFKYFAEAFDVQGHPVPDTTTLAGNRIYFSHIDGDGWNSVSQVLKYRDKPTLAGEVLMQEIIAPYPDMPVTLAFIGADIDLQWYGSEKGRALARDLLALPQVQAGVHTHSHPFSWEFYHHYTPEREKPYLHRYWQGSWAGEKAPKMPENYQYDLENYYVPRAYAKEPYDLSLEVNHAKSVVESLAGGKPVNIQMWSGDCLPYGEAIAQTYAAGMLNINGGDNRFDERLPSYSWLAPLGREVDGQRQIYAAASNENTYTNGWQRPYLGFDLLKQTWDNTESPIRVKPMNLYYHVFSAEHGTGLAAVKGNLEYARAQEITPITAHEYSALALGFYSAQFEALDENRWSVSNRGSLQTIRFDEAEGKAVDWTRSSGIIGQRHHQGSLYVYLDAASEAPVIALDDKKEAGADAYLVSSRWQIRDVSRSVGGDLAMTVQGFGDGVMRWQMPAAGNYRVTLAGEAPLEVKTDEKGELSLKLPAKAVSPVRLTIASAK